MRKGRAAARLRETRPGGNEPPGRADPKKDTMKKSHRNAFCHVLNPLHMYCRLRDLGFCKKKAARGARMYEAALKAGKGLVARITGKPWRESRIPLALAIIFSVLLLSWLGSQP